MREPWCIQHFFLKGDHHIEERRGKDEGRRGKKGKVDKGGDKKVQSGGSQVMVNRGEGRIRKK